MEHAEEKIYSPVCVSDDKKKTVYLIGDSITVGYRENVKELLKDEANVVYPTENGRSSQFDIIMLRGWSGLCDPENVGVVQFNAGHWDIAHWNDEPISLTSVDEYCNNVIRIYESLRRMYKNARIVFATTTPMNPNGENSVNYRYTSEIEKYNKAAKQALDGKDVIINDLFEYTKDFTESDFADYCHFTDEANERLGRHCAELFASLLK